MGKSYIFILVQLFLLQTAFSLTPQFFSQTSSDMPPTDLPPFSCGTDTYVPISGLQGGEGTFFIGFSFNYVGVNYDYVWVCQNGFIVMGPTGGNDFSNNLCGTSSGLLNLLAPFWDDLNLGNGGYITVGRQGVAPNRVFIVQYDSVHFFSGSGAVTFQIKLYETKNVIDFLYGPGIPNPNATGHVGINKAPGGSGNIIDITPGVNCGATTTSTTTCTNVPYNIPNGTLYRFGTGIPLGTGTNYGLKPRSYVLYQNYPNPFNPSTTIQFGLPKSGITKITVYDLLGREVETLVNEFKKPGTYEATFDASSLASGLYLYKIETDDYIDSKKMLLVK